ncbi:unnamed protein product [Prorocentrum cordatum]|uniref:Uncharacterized protein n=1 Tax=Prorocentrum cordatum TaxID=2364126 RepID=A0ABN9RWY4_9DINO|nr:unnamed protein product [Polarella glacialis]
MTSPSSPNHRANPSKDGISRTYNNASIEFKDMRGRTMTQHITSSKSSFPDVESGVKATGHERRARERGGRQGAKHACQPGARAKKGCGNARTGGGPGSAAGS